MRGLFVLIFLLCIQCYCGDEDVFPPKKLIVPNIVHQTYDYQSPSFFMYLSLLCVQRFIKPDKHILWVNNEGRFRPGEWQNWQNNAKEGSWERNLTNLIKSNKIHIEMLPFPGHPPGNESIYAPNKAHRSDFVRMNALKSMGGIYLDTDAFAINSVDSLRIHNFTLSFDNIVNPDTTAPKRCNNGVLLASPNSHFLYLWMEHYKKFNPASFDYDSSVAPYFIATQYPDIVNIEMNRISPISFGFQTNKLAEAITCGILVPPTSSRSGAIWHPVWTRNGYSFVDTVADKYMYEEVSKKLVLHLTMSQEKGICMMRRHLSSPEDLNKMPSLLGRIFRIALYGYDNFDYSPYVDGSVEARQAAWKACKHHMGMHLTPDVDDKSRQQYTDIVHH